MDPPECHGHAHDHDHEDGLGLHLRKYIDLSRVFCLNEEIAGSGVQILKPHDERLSATPSLSSPDGDAELILYIPFTEAVTIQSISIHNAAGSNATTSSSSSSSSPPRRVKLFVDRNDLDFETARELPPSQELELLPPHHLTDGTVDYPLRPAGRFQTINSITLFVMTNYDESEEDGTVITYIGFKGKGTKLRKGAVRAVYESRGMLKDHKVPDEYGASSVL